MATVGTERVQAFSRSAPRHPLVRPALAVAVGILALIVPSTVALVAALAFGVYALGDGLITVIEALLAPAQPGRGQRVVAGLLVAGLGLTVVIWPREALSLGVVAFAGSVVLLGVIQALTGIARRRLAGGAWGMAVAAGVIAIVFGACVILWPNSGLIWITWTMGGWAVLWGAATLWFAAQLRALTRPAV